MVGQHALRSRIGSMVSNGSFPKASALLGERGCGKHTMAGEIAKSLGVPFSDITESLSPEFMSSLAERPFPAIYAADLSQVGEREQNMLLKFAEEPPDGAYVMVLAERREAILPTLLGRCVTFEFAPYSADELRQVMPDVDERALKWATTPGQLSEIDWRLVPDMEKTCDGIIANMRRANLPNALSLAGRFNLGNDFSKFDVRMFVRMLLSKLVEAYAGGDARSGRMLRELSGRSKALLDSRIALEPFVNSMLIGLWEASR